MELGASMTIDSSLTALRLKRPRDMAGSGGSAATRSHSPVNLCNTVFLDQVLLHCVVNNGRCYASVLYKPNREVSSALG